MSEPPTGPPDGPAQRTVTDARTVRALAHPVRLSLLEALARHGPLTATRAAELLNDTPGNMSWHLQTLAKYGFVEEAGGGRGRSRPWRAISRSNTFETTEGDPATVAAGDALEAVFQDRNLARQRDWRAARGSYPAAWRKAAFSADAFTYLTAAELAEVEEEMLAVMRKYHDRVADREARPPGSLPVHLVAYGHPLPPLGEGGGEESVP